ncbi:MAG TPA: hypothetical protein VHA54_11915 [Solirubrobacterales bacterium]|nr:hypothetical protein [Solirubrobacterales bacterium]
MLLRVPRAEAEAILGAMRAVALEHGTDGVTEMDRETILGAATIVFGLEEIDTSAIEPVAPERLAAVVPGGEEAERAVRMLAVMSLADGVADAEKTALVRSYAEALGVRDGYLEILTEVAADEIAQATACMVRKNAESFPHLDSSRLEESAIAPFLPYRDAPDPELEARYAALGELPAESFGRAFYDHFKRNSFEFPGNPNGLAEGFTTPHDSSHVLSGYSTSEAGELCVSTFIGAMHPDHPMAAEVLPVIYSWHLGVKLNDIAKSSTGAFEPRRFWTAWERGAATSVDVVAPDWDFWAATEAPLQQLRTEYGVPPADPALLP